VGCVTNFVEEPVASNLQGQRVFSGKVDLNTGEVNLEPNCGCSLQNVLPLINNLSKKIKCMSAGLVYHLLWQQIRWNDKRDTLYV